MLITARTAPAKARRDRTTPAVRPLTKMLINSATVNSTDALRIQRLRLLGIIGQRAALIAALAWGEANNG